MRKMIQIGLFLFEFVMKPLMKYSTFKSPTIMSKL